MRVSVGGRVGPLRVSQRVGLPRGRRGASTGYNSLFALIWNMTGGLFLACCIISYRTAKVTWPVVKPVLLRGTASVRRFIARRWGV